MKIIIKPNESDISRMLLTAIRCNQELDFREGTFTLLSTQVLQEFLDEVLDEFDEFDLKIRKLNSIPQKEELQEEEPQEEIPQKEELQEEEPQEEIPQEEELQEEELQEEIPQEEELQEDEPQEVNNGRQKRNIKRNANSLPELENLSQIPEFNNMLDLKKLANLMNISKKQQEKFVKLVNVVVDSKCQVDMKSIQIELERNGIDFNASDRRICSNACRDYFEAKGYYVTFLKFLKLYQMKVEELEKNKKKENFLAYFEDKSSKPKIEQTKKTLELSDIPEFKIVIDSMDYSKSKEKVVESILLAMDYDSLSMPVREDLFITSCIAVSIKVVEWEQINYNYKSLMQDDYDNAARNEVGKFIHNYFESKGHECSYLKFLQLLNAEFGERYFGQNESVNFIDSIEDKKEKTETKETLDSKEVNKIKLPCMPSAPDFEQFLGTLDQEESIAINLKRVLDYMGISRFSEEDQDIISKIANIAISMQEPSYNLIFEEVDVKSEMEAKAICSEFVNKFARKYDPKAKIKFMDEFMIDLQNVI